MSAAKEYVSSVSRTKDVRWFNESILEKLTPEAKKLLLEYSKVPEESLAEHIQKARDYAWKIFPFPCLGNLWFLTLGLSRHSYYPKLLNRFKTEPETRLLDIGTCLGQDLRKLAFDGAPISSLYGTDVFSENEKAGFMLFNDADRFSDHFFATNFLSFEEDSAIAKTKGTWNVLTATMFLHVFDLPSQEICCRHMFQLVAGKGSWIMGLSNANVTAGEIKLQPPFVKEGEEKSIYRQSKESFEEMWERVAKELGRKVTVWTGYEDFSAEEEKQSTFKRDDLGAQKRMWFFVEVLD